MEYRSPLSLHSIEDQYALELPDRQALSLVNANLAIPVNAALSANILSDGAAALSSARQNAPVSQGAVGAIPVFSTQ